MSFWLLLLFASQLEDAYLMKRVEEFALNKEKELNF